MTPSELPVEISESQEPQYPAKLLTGVQLDGGWKIVEKLSNAKTRRQDLTPGFFSVGYRAERDKESAFLKAFDLEATVACSIGDNNDPTEMMKALQNLTSAFNAENSLLEFCKNSNLDKIVKVIKVGYANPPVGVATASPFPVPYLMFELAEGGDIRGLIQKNCNC